MKTHIHKLFYLYFRGSIRKCAFSAVLFLIVSVAPPAAAEGSADQKPPPPPAEAEPPATAPDEPTEPDEPSQPDEPLTHPVVRHLPPTSLTSHQPFDLEVTIDADWLAEVFVLRYRTTGSAEWQEAPFRRATSRTFAARVPGGDVREPSFEYAIVSDGTRGRASHFASESAPMRVIVLPGEQEVLEAMRSERHDGHRNRVAVRGSHTDFGTRDVSERGSDPNETLARSEWLWAGVAEVRHRLWGDVYDLYFRLQVERGAFGSVETPSGRTQSLCTASDCRRLGGLYAGRGGVTFELSRFLSVELDAILAASHRGFGAGAGGLVRIGEIDGTRFEVEGEGISLMGGRGAFRLAWDTVPRVPMSLGMEVGNRPDPRTATTSSTLVYTAGLELPRALTVEARVGSALRQRGMSYGWTAGLGLLQEF